MSADALTRPIDMSTSLPPGRFEFSHAAAAEADRVLASGTDAVWRELLMEQENEASVLIARRIIAAFLAAAPLPAARDTTAEDIAGEVATARIRLRPLIDTLRACDAETRRIVLRQRAPIALLDGCWNDTVSQPATQPSALVNQLVAHSFFRHGAGEPGNAIGQLRRRALAAAGVFLPEVTAREFLSVTQARPLTVHSASFYLALSRLPANFLPEIIAVHYTFGMMGVDDRLLDVGSGPRPNLDRIIADFLGYARMSGTAATDVPRLLRAIRLVIRLETEHVGALVDLAQWHGRLSLDERVGQIITRHARYAGSQHGGVRIGGRKLSDTLADPELDVARFVSQLRGSRQLRPGPAGGNRLLDSIKFGGPMFGIFDDAEAEVLTAWSKAVAVGEPAGPAAGACTAGDDAARNWDTAIAAYRPADVELVTVDPRDAARWKPRELFHRLVNIEKYPGTITRARDYTDQVLERAELLFTGGSSGRFTDASWFEYSAGALLERVEDIYWAKLVGPYRPLDEIPDRDAVIENQKRYALAALVDGAWIHRIGNVGRVDRPGVAAVHAIHADEMGRGDLAKNHITLINRVLASMSIELPHIRERAFIEERVLPELPYAFANHQLSLGLFPDSRYPEILGFTLGIELFGLGEVRLHEIQKLRHHGLDTCYEEAHLTIDNVSAGHARQAVDIINGYLDSVARNAGSAAVAGEWRRVWRGYASFALFVEADLMRKLMVRNAN
ncbi:iron-containing redox enzyme family protein [Nocardia uniformis]|uniref:Iron-containing redox enzyme family protein n=1 Tax=Nocardia uniformis TaxID=53432 RepID=A0A849BU35_9NOCA|nr:iron-containing redox enzyme family protein [Nocardia uniformis]NNH68366.1 iron-containing redox enzyme family protein [Nocardia uniformis]